MDRNLFKLSSIEKKQVFPLELLRKKYFQKFNYCQAWIGGGAFTAQVMMGQQLGLNSFERWTQIRVTIRPDVVSHVTQDLNASTTYLMRRPLPKPFSMDLDAVSSGIHRLSSLLYNYAFKIFSVGICKENSVERILKKRICLPISHTT